MKKTLLTSKSKNNITLIGMAGSGKSTVGKLLAKKLNYRVIDGDKYIEAQEKMKLQQIIDALGDKKFIQIEEKRILELLKLNNTILAPGGSIIYSKKLMEVIRKSSLVIFLDVSLEIIEKRLGNKAMRGIVGLKAKSVKELYKERLPLYKKYADLTISGFKRTSEDISQVIIKKLKAKNEKN